MSLISKPNQRFVDLRKASGKTQREVAEDLRVSETYIRNLERGRCVPSVEMLFRTSQYFKTDVYDLWSVLVEQVYESVS